MMSQNWTHNSCLKIFEILYIFMLTTNLSIIDCLSASSSIEWLLIHESVRI